MGTQEELAKRLLIRFKGVPNFGMEDAEELIGESMRIHGFSLSDEVPDDEQRIVILFAQSEAAFQIAYSVAHYFNYSDGEESVDKSRVANSYRQLANDVRKEYASEKERKEGSVFKFLSRADRL